MDWVNLWLVAVLQNHLKLKTSFSTERKVFCPSSVPRHSSGCPSFSKLICLLISTVSLCTPGYPRDPPCLFLPTELCHSLSCVPAVISNLCSKTSFFSLKNFSEQNCVEGPSCFLCALPGGSWYALVTSWQDLPGTDVLCQLLFPLHLCFWLMFCYNHKRLHIRS